MAISDIYMVTSSLVTISSTSQSPILLIKGSTTSRTYVVGVRVDIGVTSAAAGNSTLFQLYRATNTPTGGTAVTPQAHDPAAPASLATATIPSFTIAPTVTAGTQLWEQELPQTTGSSWEEFPPLGYEWQIPVNSGSTGWLVVMVTNSVATGTPVSCDIVFSQ